MVIRLMMMSPSLMDPKEAATPSWSRCAIEQPCFSTMVIGSFLIWSILPHLVTDEQIVTSSVNCNTTPPLALDLQIAEPKIDMIFFPSVKLTQLFFFLHPKCHLWMTKSLGYVPSTHQEMRSQNGTFQLHCWHLQWWRKKSPIWRLNQFRSIWTQ